MVGDHMQTRHYMVNIGAKTITKISEDAFLRQVGDKDVHAYVIKVLRGECDILDVPSEYRDQVEEILNARKENRT